MTADTPTPYVPPDGVILTTAGEVRRVGHGQTMPVMWSPKLPLNWGEWAGLAYASEDDRVWWRPTPERTVTIELPECDVRAISIELPEPDSADRDEWATRGDRLVAACRDAVARLDGET